MLAILAFLTAPAGLLLMYFSRWPWTWKLSFLTLWAMSAWSTFGFLKPVVGAALLTYAVALVATGSGPIRWAGAAGVVLLVAAVVAPYAPLVRTATLEQRGRCPVAYAEAEGGFVSLPLHGSACVDGGQVVYQWEDCGGSSAWIDVLQTCRHRALPDGSLEMTTDYRLRPWFTPWWTRTGSASFRFHPDGTVSGLRP